MQLINHILFQQAYNKVDCLSYPIISDPKRELAVTLGMVDPDEKDKAGLPVTCRAVSRPFNIMIILFCHYNYLLLLLKGFYHFTREEIKTLHLVSCHYWT